jgi:uncharacterized membrane protein
MATTGPGRQGSAKDPMRHYVHYQRGKPGGSAHAGGSSFMERVSEAVASGMGSVAFLIASSAVILAWVLLNHVITFVGNSWTGLLDGKGFDPAPFILLNLIFSAVAFYTGALVIIAQKAQTRTDHANEVAGARHREELAQAQGDLLQKNTDLTEQIHDLAMKITTLTEQVHAATCGPRLPPDGRHGPASPDRRAGIRRRCPGRPGVPRCVQRLPGHRARPPKTRGYARQLPRSSPHPSVRARS